MDTVTFFRNTKIQWASAKVFYLCFIFKTLQFHC